MSVFASAVFLPSLRINVLIIIIVKIINHTRGMIYIVAEVVDEV